MSGYRYLVDSKTARISKDYAAKAGISTEEAMKMFLSSRTYRILSDEETGVFLEVFEFVYDMFLEEIGEFVE